VHLFERECSVQRNYQKLIEEAPAARLTEGIREKLYTRALAIGRAIGYDSLGTIEFVLEEGTAEPYFLEMNTRLQVEHTVTEAITGLDLVEWQLRIAAGEVLPLAQEAITQRGWAIEARVNCENPAAGYRPELGTITCYVEPVASGLRVDSGVQMGMTIPPNYDSLMAKVIAWSGTRGLAIDRLAAGLADYEIDGVGTNQLFLRDILLHDNFRNGSLTTRFIAEAFPDGWRPHPAVAEDARIAAAFACSRRNARRNQHWIALLAVVGRQRVSHHACRRSTWRRTIRPGIRQHRSLRRGIAARTHLLARAGWRRGNRRFGTLGRTRFVGDCAHR
jgi:3-methylcrotonyl-CoA carboxylase alpha subunit